MMAHLARIAEVLRRNYAGELTAELPCIVLCKGANPKSEGVNPI